MSKRAAIPAGKWMHTQSSICCVSLTASVVTLIMTLIVCHQIQEGKDELTAQGSSYTPWANMPDTYATMEKQMEDSKYAGYIGIPVCICVGCLFMVISRQIIDSRNGSGLQFCCICEGICSACSCCEGLSYCAYFVFLCVVVAAFSDPTSICNHEFVVSGTSAANGLTTPSPIIVGGTTAQPTLSPADLANCEQWVRSLKPAIQSCAIWMAIMAFLACLSTALCGAASKFAKETEEAFEDEEGGWEYDNDAGYY